jgi:CheY-like chemotaxis protein
MPRVLIADDDRGFREMLRDLLGDEGFYVFGEAEDGTAGVALVGEAPPGCGADGPANAEPGGKRGGAKINGILPTLRCSSSPPTMTRG